MKYPCIATKICIPFLVGTRQDKLKWKIKKKVKLYYIREIIQSYLTIEKGKVETVLFNS